MLSSFFSRLFRKTPPNYSLSAGVRLYAIGDIHGQAALLETGLQKIQKDAESFEGERILEIFLGDYIDRGMYSREVIDLLLQPPPNRHERICLMGNHEATLLQFLKQPDTIRKWSNYGGFTTLASYGISIPPNLSNDSIAQLHQAFLHALPASHRHFMENLALSYTIGDYFFTHAGINPYAPLDEQDEQDLLWIRDPFLNFKGFYEKYIVHGHTPVKSVDLTHNRANLDLSIAPNEQLGCLKVEGRQRTDFTISGAE